MPSFLLAWSQSYWCMLSYPCNAYHESIYLLQSCVNMVFKLVCRPPSLSSSDQDSNPFSSHCKHTPPTCIHIHPLGLFFTRPIMPQVKYLRRCFWFVGNCFYSQPSPRGVVCALDCFAGMTKRSHEFVIKEEIKFVNTSNVREQPRCFHQILHMDRDVQGRKSWYSEAIWNSRSNASKINEFEDPYKEIWQKLWMLRVLKFETDCSAGIKWT